MFIFKTAAELQHHLHQAGEGKRTGFIPTMGALHHGHLSLVKEARNKDCYTVCSIFVNPTQFNNPADLEKYPVSLENDIRLLAGAGCNVLFLPSVAEMYGSQVQSEGYDYGTLTASYEGMKRPGHFDGVLTIVSRLFRAVRPDEVFFGQKDLQQCMVVHELIKRDFPGIRFNMLPIQREENGLAASSRNRRLGPDEKARAANIYHALAHARQRLKQGMEPAEAIREATTAYLHHPALTLEYFDLVDASSMTQAATTGKPGNHALVIACWCAGVRLIDNMLLTD